MLVLVAKLTVQAGRETEFEQTMRKAVPEVRKEPGNHAYILHRSNDNPRLFMVYEQYDDQAALDAHRNHLREMKIDIRSFLEGGVVLETYDMLL